MKTKVKKPWGIIYSWPFAKALLPLSVLLISMTSRSQEQVSRYSGQGGKIITGNYREVEVYGDMTLILVNIPPDKRLSAAISNRRDCIKTESRKGKLIIDAGKCHYFSRPTVYLPIRDLRSLVINGDSKVVSSGVIRTPGLEIFLNGNASVSVKYTGVLRIKPAEGTDIEYINHPEKKTKTNNTK